MNFNCYECGIKFERETNKKILKELENGNRNPYCSLFCQFQKVCKDIKNRKRSKK